MKAEPGAHKIPKPVVSIYKTIYSVKESFSAP